MTDKTDALAGCLVGGAIGDAIGLPLEGIDRRRAAKIFRGQLRYRFLFGRGMISDDTEHACLTALALARCGGDEQRFAQFIGAGIRAWLLTLPAGTGLATLRAALKLSVRISPLKSGVNSAGNGPAMRAAVIGSFFGEDRSRMRRYIELSSRVTHTDARAVDGAYLVALAASGEFDFQEVRRLGTQCWHLDGIEMGLADNRNPADFAASIGVAKGVSGFIAHTVPVAIYCALWAGEDFERAIQSAACLGGDTDTLCAIVGGIVGSRVGYATLPTHWIEGLWEWPRSIHWMRRTANALANGTPPPKTNWIAYAARSPIFISAVLAHGFRRLLPPC